MAKSLPLLLLLPLLHVDIMAAKFAHPTSLPVAKEGGGAIEENPPIRRRACERASERAQMATSYNVATEARRPINGEGREEAAHARGHCTE